MATGDKTWFFSVTQKETDKVAMFTGIWPVDAERAKQKKPTELAVACLSAAETLFEKASADYINLATASTAVKNFIEQKALNSSFNQTLQAWGAPIFLAKIGEHILGKDIPTFKDTYNSILRTYYTSVIAPCFVPLTGVHTLEESINHRRVVDATIALIFVAMEMAEKQAQEFLTRIGWSGDTFIQATHMNTAFTKCYDSWFTEGYGVAAMLMKPGEFMKLVHETDKLRDRVTVYRRRTEVAPRLTLTRTPNGDKAVYSFKYRDRSAAMPIRDYVAAGYKHMAYAIDGEALVPIVDTDDISALMLDLVIPVSDEASERTIDTSTAHAVVAGNPNVSFNTQHIERYLTDDGLATTTELASFNFEAPKGCNGDLFSINPINTIQGANTIETIAILSNPDAFTSCNLTLLGDKASISGIAAVEYSRYFASLVFGSLIPLDTDTGNITIQMGDIFQAPNRILELPTFIGPGPHYLDKTMVRRIAVGVLGLPENCVEDTEVTMIGDSLMDYYLRVLYLLGFDDIAKEVATVANYTRAERSALGSFPMYMSWTCSAAYLARMKPYGILGKAELRYKVAMLQVFFSKVTNDRVRRALLHAMSLYLSYNFTMAGKTVEEMWKGNLVGSLV